MSIVIRGIGASPGHACGTVRRLQMPVWRPAHRLIGASEVEREVARFEEACRRAAEHIRETRASSASALGEVAASIFEPQIMLLSDPEIVVGTVRHIRENLLSAERAFDWRLAELQAAMLGAGHAMVLDRIADLRDIRWRVIAELDGAEQVQLALPREEALIAIEDLTPSIVVRFDPEVVLGIVTAAGSRTSHSALLARSLGIPAVVGAGIAGLAKIVDGCTALLDGSTGRVVLNPEGAEVAAHDNSARRPLSSRGRLSSRREDPSYGGAAPPFTADGVRVRFRANIDHPGDVASARRAGAEGIGLLRSEFLFIGQRTIPTEEEQYQAYREAFAGFPGQPVTLRTFDIGGDKRPLFLNMSPEDNPYLGWRAIRICLDMPDLFLNQIRAAVRAAVPRGSGEAGGSGGKAGESGGAAGGSGGGSGSREEPLRLLIPFVTSESEILRTKEIVAEAINDTGVARHVLLGIMVETPAIADTLDIVARHIDFVSLGTNDLVQYTLAVDRGNARVQHLADPLHPALLRSYRRVFAAAREAGLDIGVCGDMAADPVGLALLLGIGYRDFSLAPALIPEAREAVQLFSANELSRICGGLESPARISRTRRRLRAYLEETIPSDAALALAR